MSATNLDLPVLISAEQIRRREFVAIRRGYDPAQVRDFLDQVADHVQQMESMLRESRMEADAAIRAASQPRVDPYTQLAGRVAGVLRAADDEAERSRRDARAEAERILSEARTDADRIRSDAQARAEEMRAEAERILQEARSRADRTIAGLSTKRDALVEQLAAMQERLVGVARDLGSTISAPEAESRTEPLAGATTEEEPDHGFEDLMASLHDGDPQEVTASETIVLGDAELPGGTDDPPFDDPADDLQMLLDPSFDELWEGTNAIGLEIPDIPPLDLGGDEDQHDD